MDDNITGKIRKRVDDPSDGPQAKKRKLKDMSFTANKRVILNFLFGHGSRYDDDLICDYNIDCYNKFILNEIIKYDVLKNIERTFISYLFEQYKKNLNMHRKKFSDNTILHILKSSTDLNCADNNGKKPIHYVCEHGNITMLNLMIEKKVDLNCETNDGKKPIQYLLKRSGDDDTFKMLKLLLKKGSMELLD
uniref:Ankyrin repeat protein n=1 Tax=Mimivirus LCMiAC01 TaxID=2506608 RepID=A0A481Z0A4_9VIRU|nr:MAG: ankyrin repeat protein [Mimivirus LCMiAC01]